MSLTARQKDCLLALQNHYDRNGVMPSVREIGRAIDESSTGGVSQLLVQLEERGFISRWYARPRAIEILKRIPTETRARCWLWDGEECGPRIGDAVIIGGRG